MAESRKERGLGGLEPLVGKWSIEAGPPDGEPWPGEAWVEFDWIEEGAFLRQRWHVDMPEAPDGIAIIGCDASNGTLFQLYTDERSVYRVYEMSFGDGEWKLWREGEDPFPQRFVGRLSDDGATIQARWEKRPDGEIWETDFDLTYRRLG